MAKKDKFQQLKQSGGTLSSFQDMVEQTNTVAAIVQQAESQQTTQQPSAQGGVVAKPSGKDKPSEQRMTHLPNPAISVHYYNLATQYCYQHDNMTRMDWMELAILEKLNRDGLITDDELKAKSEEIRNRPPRGMRKNTKTQTNK